MRITGLSGSGLDIDTMVKDTMKPYQMKVDQTIQKQDVTKIKQQLYRDVMTQSSDFFNKYLDISKSDSLLLSGNYKSVAFTSSNDSAVTATSSSEAILDNYNVKVTQLAAKASTTLKDTVGVGQQTLTTSAGVPITFNVVNNLSTAKDNATATIDNFNKAIENAKKGSLSADQLKSLNITGKYSDFSKGIVFTANDFGQGDFTIDGKDGAGTPYTTLKATDKYLNATITNSKGDPSYNITNDNKLTSNTATIDGVTFTFNNITTTDATLTGKRDVTEIKDKIVKFVNDYNTLIKNLNTTINTKHDRSYDPLTADQKKDMKDTEITLWEGKVKAGQLYKDSDISRITDSLKQSMRTLISDSGLSLEQIGIKPVKDYSGVNNGTFTIDEEKLTKALGDNTENVAKLFTTSSPTKEELDALPSDEARTKRKNQTGILSKLKDTMNQEIMRSDSALAMKVGIEGTSTFTNNTLTKSISDYENKIKDMQKDLATREQALYSKYSTLETMMNKFNSQQSSLASLLGK
ncbi:flagellar filament capping protein FliD [Clostridium uliginosum]|uniref:Flagellar hook-associated protein 2 n=1 Tax=Clostridium uliginosum TaxID=119641 RepID=A0A1I1KIR2_9CLOT|nr:flagellar filament capping protein FliD [Clostridium uliginosum]SFC60659.1 flagellar hook-associated protein 2 [Clostridium uliginosum]